MPRPRLLFLSQSLPYPPDGGVHIRTYNLLKVLSTEYDIDALCFFRRRVRPTPADVAASAAGLARYARVTPFAIPQEFSRSRLIRDHVSSLVTSRPYTFYAYASQAFRQVLLEKVRTTRYVLAHVDSLDLSCFLPALSSLPVACTHHNIESALLYRRAAFTSHAVTRGYIHLQSHLTRREEARWAPRVALNVVVSDVDRERLLAIAPGSRVAVVPNGVDTDWFRGTDGPKRGVVFVGGESWFPNADGMEFFATQVLPSLRQLSGDVPVTWVGRVTPVTQRRFADQFGIACTGFVEDVRPYLDGAACVVVPLRVGGGTRLKILDAWAMGKAIVSTKVGCEGLAAEHGTNILIMDKPDAFARAVAAVLAKADLREKLGRSARQVATNVYDWVRVGEQMLSAYGRLAESA